MGSRTRSTPIFSGKENPKIITNKLFHLPVGMCPACMFMQAITDVYIQIESFNAILQIKLWNVCCRVRQHCASHVTQSRNTVRSFKFCVRVRVM